MLKQRVITALILLAILLPALFYPSPAPFAAIVLVLVAAAGWEWSRLNGFPGAAAIAAGLAVAAASALAWRAGWPSQDLRALWITGAIVWIVGSIFLLRAGVAGWGRVPRGVRWIVGLIALWLAWLAVAHARTLGVNFLLSVLALVWAADVFAYFAGRRFGLRFTKGKLAPTISPGKSWEGAWGGFIGVIVVALVWIAADRALGAAVPSFYSRLAGHSPWLLVLGLAVMTALSVAGDLVESLVKRSAGAKDSSALLPGHGGVLDRIDALLPTLPLALALISFASA